MLKRKLLSVMLCLFICVVPLAAEEPCPESDCSEVPMAAPEIPTITFEEVLTFMKGQQPFVLLDTRSLASYQTGHLPGAKSFPYEEMNRESAVRLIPEKTKVIVYCASAKCSLSHNAAVLLKNLGYDVSDYKGGVREWTERGQALDK